MKVSVSGSTIGNAGPNYGELRKNYRWNGAAFPPGHPEYVYQPEDKPRSSSQETFAASSTSRKAERMRKLETCLAAGLTPVEAAKKIGVGDKTAAEYIRVLRGVKSTDQWIKDLREATR